MELPPPAGLQGGPSAPAHPVPRVLPKAKPHVVRESKPVPKRHRGEALARGSSLPFRHRKVPRDGRASGSGESGRVIRRSREWGLGSRQQHRDGQ